MNQILRCDWLPERARWGYLARSGLPAVKPYNINALLTKLAQLKLPRSFLILQVYGPRLRLGS